MFCKSNLAALVLTTFFVCPALVSGQNFRGNQTATVANTSQQFISVRITGSSAKVIGGSDGIGPNSEMTFLHFLPTDTIEVIAAERSFKRQIGMDNPKLTFDGRNLTDASGNLVNDNTPPQPPNSGDTFPETGSETYNINVLNHVDAKVDVMVDLLGKGGTRSLPVEGGRFGQMNIKVGSKLRFNHPVTQKEYGAFIVHGGTIVINATGATFEGQRMFERPMDSVGTDSTGNSPASAPNLGFTSRGP